MSDTQLSKSLKNSKICLLRYLRNNFKNEISIKAVWELKPSIIVLNHRHLAMIYTTHLLDIAFGY